MAEKWRTESKCPECAQQKRSSYVIAQLWGSPEYRFTCERSDCPFVKVGQSDFVDRSIGLKKGRNGLDS